jgi:hypothetical protein
VQRVSDEESQSDTMFGYFYLDFNDVEKQSSRKAVRSLLFQFAQQARNGLQNVEQLYQKCGSGHQQPAEDVIRSLLRDIMGRIESALPLISQSKRDDFPDNRHGYSHHTVTGPAWYGLVRVDD